MHPQTLWVGKAHWDLCAPQIFSLRWAQNGPKWAFFWTNFFIFYFYFLLSFSDLLCLIPATTFPQASRRTPVMHNLSIHGMENLGSIFGRGWVLLLWGCSHSIEFFWEGFAVVEMVDSVGMCLKMVGSAMLMVGSVNEEGSLWGFWERWVVEGGFNAGMGDDEKAKKSHIFSGMKIGIKHQPSNGNPSKNTQK